MSANDLRRPIGVVQGAESDVVQAVIAAAATRLSASLRLVGVVERPCATLVRACMPAELRSVMGERAFRLFQDLGPGSTACSLDPQGVGEACAAVCDDIAKGCDLVVLSKFGKLEAESGSGLMPAFVEALSAGLPILTSVSPRYAEHWRRFAEPYYEMLPADEAAVVAWCREAAGAPAG